VSVVCAGVMVIVTVATFDEACVARCVREAVLTGNARVRFIGE